MALQLYLAQEWALWAGQGCCGSLSCFYTGRASASKSSGSSSLGSFCYCFDCCYHICVSSAGPGDLHYFPSH